MAPDSVGERIRRVRIARGLTIKQLSDKSGVASSTLSLVERAKRDGDNLTVETIRKLAQALAVTTDYLCGMYEELEGEHEHELWPAGSTCDQALALPEGLDHLEMAPA